MTVETEAATAPRMTKVKAKKEATETKDLKQLSGRRLLFVQELLLDPKRNASAAYKAAGYKWKNERVAESSASKLLRSAEVQAAIAERDAELKARYQADQDAVIERLMRGVRFDIRCLYHLQDNEQQGIKAGQLKLPHELSDDEAALVVGTKYSGEGVFTGYQVIDVKGSCELVGRHLKMFTDKMEVKKTWSLEELCDDSDDEA
jgi:phage terminase small subunit